MSTKLVWSSGGNAVLFDIRWQKRERERDIDTEREKENGWKIKCGSKIAI